MIDGNIMRLTLSSARRMRDPGSGLRMQRTSSIYLTAGHAQLGATEVKSLANLMSVITLQKTPLEKRILTLVLIIICLSLILGTLIFNRSFGVLQSQTRVSKDVGIVIQADDIETTMLNMETGQRGYLLTGNPSYLQPYTQGLHTISDQLAGLQKRLPADDHTAHVLLHELQLHIKLKMQELARTIRLRQTSGFLAAVKIVDTNTGQEQMNLIRANLTAIVNQYMTRVHRERAMASEQMKQTLIWVITGSLLFIGFLIFVYRQLSADVVERRNLTARLAYESTHDALTRLPNRRSFLESLQSHVAQANDHSMKLALLFIDLDGFKGLNDTLGHAYGDQALEVVSRLFESVKQETDILARLGGDEFAILCVDVQDEQTLSAFVQKLLMCMKDPQLKALSPYLGASIGVAVFPDHAQSADDLLHAADQAMYEAKAHGGRRAKICAR